jgi:hypothetical protein
MGFSFKKTINAAKKVANVALAPAKLIPVASVAALTTVGSLTRIPGAKKLDQRVKGELKLTARDALTSGKVGGGIGLIAAGQTAAGTSLVVQGGTSVAEDVNRELRETGERDPSATSSVVDPSQVMQPVKLPQAAPLTFGAWLRSLLGGK